jgi:hypothetical protein
VPKKPQTFRLSESSIATLKKYQKESCSLTDALENALQRLQYLEDLALKTETPKDVPECKRRIELAGQYYCVQTNQRGLMRTKEIPTLEVCRICKLERWKIPESTEVKQTQQIPADKHAWIRDPNKAKPLGMKWCREGGILVFPSKCEKCKTPC